MKRGLESEKKICDQRIISGKNQMDFFEKCVKKTISLLLSIDALNKKKVSLRINELLDGILIDDNGIVRFKEQYYSRMHELKSYEFLKKVADVDYNADADQRKGVDLLIVSEDDHVRYNIECVKCSFGSIEKGDLFSENNISYEKESGLEFRSGTTDDFRSVFIPRITTVLKEKKERINTYIADARENNTINLRFEPSSPTILFVSLGEIADDYVYSSESDLIETVLYGKGDMIINLETRKQGYESIEKVKKSNDANIEVGLLNGEEYNEISGVLFTTATLREEYNRNNTFMYINHNANKMIETGMFEKICEVKKK